MPKRTSPARLSFKEYLAAFLDQPNARAYDDDPQGGIVARPDVKSEVLTWPSTLPSSSMSTPDQAPDCARILTLAFRGTLLSGLHEVADATAAF